MIRVLLALALLTSSARAEILTVSPGGLADFIDIQSAVDSATEADVIFVQGGGYAGFTVENKTVQMIGVNNPIINETVFVQGLSATQSAVFSGMHFTTQYSPPTNTSVVAVEVTSCIGAVRFQDCRIGMNTGPSVLSAFPASLRIDSCENVAIASCDLFSAIAYNAMTVQQSNVGSAQSVFSGGADDSCHHGGDGVYVDSSSYLFDAASFAQGADGADEQCSTGNFCFGYGGCGSNGGSGFVNDNGVVELLETALMGGLGGSGFQVDYYTCYFAGLCNGVNGGEFSTLFGAIPPTFLSGTARRSSYASSVLEGGTLTVSVEGEVSDEVTLMLSKEPLFDSTDSGSGVQLVGPAVSNSALYREFSLGTLATTTANIPVNFQLEGEGFTNATWFAQTIFTDAAQNVWYGPGRTVTVLGDPSLHAFAQFCNGDGGNQAGCTNCPCMNNAPAGTIGGCLNSSLTSARLEVAGDASVSLPSGALNDLRITVADAPPTSFCRLVSGSALAPAGMANPCFGMGSGVQAMQFDGLRCAIAGVIRHGGRHADASGVVGGRGGTNNDAWGGEAAPAIGLAQQAGFAAGATRYFQVIARDFHNLSCMTGLNTTQAVQVTFTP